MVHWLPENLKILFYTFLGAALNFTVIFSVVDLFNSGWEQLKEWMAKRQGGIRRRNINRRREHAYASAASSSGYGYQSKSLTSNGPRVLLLSVTSVLSGMFFGFMFGELRIEEEASYRVALALQQEAVYTYPFGSLVGGISGMLYQQLVLMHRDEYGNYRAAYETSTDL